MAQDLRRAEVFNWDQLDHFGSIGEVRVTLSLTKRFDKIRQTLFDGDLVVVLLQNADENPGKAHSKDFSLFVQKGRLHLCLHGVEHKFDYPVARQNIHSLAVVFTPCLGGTALTLCVHGVATDMNKQLRNSAWPKTVSRLREIHPYMQRHVNVLEATLESRR